MRQLLAVILSGPLLILWFMICLSKEPQVYKLHIWGGEGRILVHMAKFGQKTGIFTRGVYCSGMKSRLGKDFKGRGREGEEGREGEKGKEGREGEKGKGRGKGSS